MYDLIKGKTIADVKDSEQGDGVIILFTDKSFVFLEAFNMLLNSDEVGVIPSHASVAGIAKETKEESKEESKEEPAETPKKSSEAVPDDEVWTWEDLEDMDSEELAELIDDEELGLDTEDYNSTLKLRKAIGEELGL